MSNSYAINSSNFEVINTNGDVYTQSPELEGTANSVNADVEEFDLTGNVSSVEANDVSDSKFSLYADLTEEDIMSLVGTMSKEEYDKFIEGIKNYNSNEKKCLQQLLDGHDGEPGINSILDSIDIGEWGWSLDYYKNKVKMSVDTFSDKEKFFDYIGISEEEFINLSYEDQLNVLKNVNTFKETFGMSSEEFLNSDVDVDDLINSIDSSKEDYLRDIIYYESCREELMYDMQQAKEYEHNCDSEVSEKYGESLGIYTISDLHKNYYLLRAKKQEIEDSISMLDNKTKSMQYDYVYYLKDYQDFNVRTEFTDEELDQYYEFCKDKTNYYSCADYIALHPEYSEEDVLFLHYATMNNSFAGFLEVSYPDYITKFLEIYKTHPQYLKTLLYLEKTNPDAIDDYIESIQYQLNQVYGEYEAKEFLSNLGYGDEDEYSTLEKIANELQVDVQGLVDGLETFFSGVGYTVEALFTWICGGEENRSYSVDEYKKMYILYALLSEKEKIDSGLIIYDEKTGKYINNPMSNVDTSVIDFSINYSCFGNKLSSNYEVTQGIGNMIPSIALSAINPAAGSYALGISAGGNAYHNAMVEGHSFISSVCYGIFSGCSESITERLFGGLPGLSDVKVTGLRTYFKSVGKEAFQEGLQEIMDIAYQTHFMGEEYDLDEIMQNVGKSSLYGGITAGILNAPSLAAATDARIQARKLKSNVVTEGANNTTTDTKVETSVDKTEVKTPTTETVGPTISEDVVQDITMTAPAALDTDTSTSFDSNVVEDANVSSDSILEHLDETTIGITSSNIISPSVELEGFKNGTISTSEFLEYINTNLKDGNLTKSEAAQFFTEIFGTKISSWTRSDEARINLLTGFLSAADAANLTPDQIKRCALVMDQMESYYDAASHLNLETNSEIFFTYRTHGIVHIYEVLTQSMNTINAMNELGIEGLDMDAVMLSAIMHDTGMSGGKQLVLTVEDGNLVYKVMDIQADGNTYRESHSFNSGVNILANYEVLKNQFGYSDGQIATAALLAFGHSKSNSGLGKLSETPAGWSFAIQALQTAVDSDPNITFNFTEALVDAGIIKSSVSTTTSEEEIAVKCPKEFVIGQDGKISQQTVEKDGIFRMEPVSTGVGGKVSGKVQVYEFNEGVVENLSYETLAVRIGDALTNNDNAKVNQYREEISFAETDWSKQADMDTILQKLREKEKLKDVTVKDVAEKATNKRMLADAAEVEASELVYKVNGKEFRKSQQFVLGEDNQTYRVETNNNGIDVVVTVKDSDRIPFCTLFAIEERYGELDSKGVKIFNEKTDGIPMKLVIEIDESSPNVDLYQQYATAKTSSGSVEVEIRYK